MIETLGQPYARVSTLGRHQYECGHLQTHSTSNSATPRKLTRIALRVEITELIIIRTD
jgi:hypothetical protein